MKKSFVTATCLIICCIICPFGITSAHMPNSDEWPPRNPLPETTSAQEWILDDTSSTRNEILEATTPSLILDDPSVNPIRVVRTLAPGQQDTVQITVYTGDRPVDKADVMFVFDLTGSMGDELISAKASAVNIVNQIRADLPNTWMGVASFMDYPGFFSYPGYAAWYGNAAYGDKPWILNLNPRESVTEVIDSINRLSLGFGEDYPESYTRVLYELLGVQWRPQTKKIAIIYGDAPAHDLSFAGYNFGGDPGPDGLANTDDDLFFVPAVWSLRDAGVTVIAVDSGQSIQSEATFKGMSEGYATAPGTNGQYFKLSNASALPSATVQLIKRETTTIDILSASVPERYRSWITFKQESFPNVRSKESRTFEAQLSVPQGTSPGFYPFVIKFIADGTVLGISYIEITVPGAGMSTDIGFRPNPDGFKFGNFNVESLSWVMFRQFFGKEAVEYPDGSRNYSADRFYRQFYRKAGEGGQCFGFSVLSLVDFYRLSQDSAGEFAFPLIPHLKLYYRDITPQMKSALAYAQGIQFSLDVQKRSVGLCNNLGQSPGAMYRYLKSLIENKEPSVVVFEWDRPVKSCLLNECTTIPPGAHAVVPYRYEEEVPNSKAYVYVYDPNRPGDSNRRIEFDFAKDKWSYRWHIPIWPDATLEGDASKCQLWVLPTDLLLQPGTPPWKAFMLPQLASQQLARPSTVNDYQSFITSGPLQLLFTDDKGRRLGFTEGQFFDEIPDAGYFAMPDNPHQASYLIPEGIIYTLTGTGSGAGEASLSAYVKNSTIELSAIRVLTGTRFRLDIQPSGDGVVFSGIVSNTHSSIAIGRTLLGQDRAVRVQQINVAPDEKVELRAVFTTTSSVSNTVTISTSATNDKMYGLSLIRNGGDGYTVFGAGNLTLPADSSISIIIPDWSSLANLRARLDIGKNGSIDQVLDLVNQARVGSLELELPRTEILAGGDELDITIAVKDQFGSYVPNGTLVTLRTSLGQLSLEQDLTVGGLVRTRLKSGSEWGIATVTASASGIVRNINVTILPRTTFLPLMFKSEQP